MCQERSPEDGTASAGRASCQLQTMKGKGISLRHELVTAITSAVHAWEQVLQDILRSPGQCDGMIKPFTTVASTISTPLNLFIPIPFMSAISIDQTITNGNTLVRVFFGDEHIREDR